MCPNGECGRVTQRTEEDDWADRILRRVAVVEVVALPLLIAGRILWVWRCS